VNPKSSRGDGLIVCRYHSKTYTAGETAIQPMPLKDDRLPRISDPIYTNFERVLLYEGILDQSTVYKSIAPTM